MSQFCWHRGTIALKSEQVNNEAKKWSNLVPSEAQMHRFERDQSDHYHITVVTAAEVSQCNLSNIDVQAVLKSIVNEPIVVFNLGFARVAKDGNESWYTVIYCECADLLRHKLQCFTKDYHITLGFNGCDLYGGNDLVKHMVKHSDISIYTRLTDVICTNMTNDVQFVKSQLRKDGELVKYTAYQLLDESQPKTATKSVTKQSTAVTNTQSSSIASLRQIAKWCMTRNDVETVSDIAYHMLSLGVVFGLKLLIWTHKKHKQSIDTILTELRGGLLPVNNTVINSDLNVEANMLHTVNLLMENAQPVRTKGQEHYINVVNDPTVYAELTAGTSQSNRLHVISMNRVEKVLDFFTLPRNFSWVRLPAPEGTTDSSADNQVYSELLAGCSYPQSEKHIIAMYGVGIRHIITLHETPLSVELVHIAAKYGITAHYWHVFDRTPPNMTQLSEICAVISEAVSLRHGTVVHCQGGVGRTNTAIIAYMLQAQTPLSARTAIEAVRVQRKMILAQLQETALKAWWTRVNSGEGTVSVVPAPVAEKMVLKSDSKKAAPITTTPVSVSHEKSEPASSVTVTPPNTAEPVLKAPSASYRKIATSLNLPPILMLCGTAASGKSTFSTALVAAQNEYFVRINKDEMRGKGQCDNALFDAMRAFNSNHNNGGTHTGVVVLDNCNLTTAVRKNWIQSVHSVRIWCIHFDLDVTLCKHRIQHRVGHPTIPPGQGGVAIIDQMVRQRETPVMKEGFERVITLKSEQDVSKLLNDWCIAFKPPGSQIQVEEDDQVTEDVNSDVEEQTSDNDTLISDTTTQEVKLLKFPRTPHIINLGAATRDDKVLGLGELKMLVDRKVHLTIEEKLDGANCGLSIDPVTNQIRIQNRSHYISSKYHPQFQPLDNWLNNHSADLYSVLIPGRHILYGEWLYATHSVYYNHLPSYFIAYDLYDRVDKIFYSRKRLLRTLSETNIQVVPLIFEGVLDSTDTLLNMVHGPSECINPTGESHTIGVPVRNAREGIVVRVCEKGRLVSRAKLVRDDFIAGNERWNKTSKLATNKLRYDV